MNYIILDLEWNQALSRETMIRTPCTLSGEIIQIGAVKTDEHFQFIDKTKIAVRPMYYKKMNRHVENITGITNAMLKCGESFPQAFRRLQAWCGDDFRIVTWGPDDISMLADNLEIHGMSRDFGADYINLQLVFNAQVDAERRQWSLSDAMQRLEIPIDAQAHDALNDAWFTYEICRKLDMEKGLANYQTIAAAVRTALRKDVVKNVESCRKMLEDARVRNAKCPQCDNTLKSCDWLIYGGGKRTTIANCPDHGDFLVKLTAKKVTDDNWTITRTLYAADDAAKESYTKKLERQRAARSRKSQRPQQTEEKNDNNGSDRP